MNPRTIFAKLFKHTNKQIAFTIPKEFKKYFRKIKNRINYIFELASITIKYEFKEKYKKKSRTHFFIMCLL